MHDVTSLFAFRVPATTDELIEVTSPDQLEGLTETLRGKRFFFTGGGYNILVVKHFKGTIVRILLKGMERIAEDDDHVDIRVAAGEDWDSFVEWTVSQGLAGLENLSGIPGTVGAAPVNNIGAYGAEVKDCLLRVHVFNVPEGKHQILQGDELMLTYRNSVFRRYPLRYLLITHVEFRLSKHQKPNTSYERVEATLSAMPDRSLASIRAAVLKLRSEKLPDYKTYPSAGSFFTNPRLAAEDARNMNAFHPEMKIYEYTKEEMKVSAAWLIEKAGCKGLREGGAMVSEQHALIIINTGNATGEDIMRLRDAVIKRVHDRFSIWLDWEVLIAED